MTVEIIIWSLIAYLFGSIPSGYVLVKLFLKQDIRHQGSGNIGATNVLRTSGKKLAFITYILDIVKVWVPMGLFSFIMNPMQDIPADLLIANLMIIGAIGVFGHMYSCWLKFDGGKGVASFMGYVVWLFPYGSVIGGVVFLIVAFSTRIVSLASLMGIVAASAYIMIYVFPELNMPLTLIWVAKLFFICSVALIFWRHKGNILRLIKGEENKIKF